MNTSKLSLAAKIVAATLLSLQAQSLYAEPVTTTESCGDGCNREITRDSESKKVKVVISSDDKNKVYSSSAYFPEPGFDIEIYNSAHLDSPDYKIASNNSSGIKSLKIENNGNLISSGRATSSIDFQWTKVLDKFEITNRGEISTTGTSDNENAIVVEGTENTIYKLHNLGENSLITAKSNSVMLSVGKIADIVNEGKITSENGNALSVVANDGTIKNFGLIGDVYVSSNEYKGHYDIKNIGENSKILGRKGLEVRYADINLYNEGEIKSAEVVTSRGDSKIVNKGVIDEYLSITNGSDIDIINEEEIKDGISIFNVDSLKIKNSGAGAYLGDVYLNGNKDISIINDGKIGKLDYPNVALSTINIVAEESLSKVEVINKGSIIGETSAFSIWDNAGKPNNAIIDIQNLGKDSLIATKSLNGTYDDITILFNLGNKANILNQGKITSKSNAIYTSINDVVINNTGLIDGVVFDAKNGKGNYSIRNVGSTSRILGEDGVKIRNAEVQLHNEGEIKKVSISDGNKRVNFFNSGKINENVLISDGNDIDFINKGKINKSISLSNNERSSLINDGEVIEGVSIYANNNVDLINRNKISGNVLLGYNNGNVSIVNEAKIDTISGNGVESLHINNLGKDSVLENISVSGKDITIINEGKIIQKNGFDTISIPYSIDKIKIINTGIIDGKSNSAIGVYNSAYGDYSPDYEVDLSAGKIIGSISLGTYRSGSLSLSNTDVSELTVLDGGRQMEEGSRNNIFNLKQKIDGSSDPRVGIGTKILSWKDINIDKMGHLNLTGDLSLTGDYEINDEGIQTDKLIWEIGDLVTNNGILSLNSSIQSADVKYSQIANNGIIDLNEGDNTPAQTLTLYGDYVGGEHSKLRVDSKWNNPDVQENDQLIIKGKASGTTKVEVKDVIAGDVIRSSVEKNGGWSKPIVIVEQGDEGKVVFTGTANTQGAEEAQLARRENGSATEYTWVLNAQVAPVMPQPATPVVPQPSPVQPSPAIPQPSQAAQSNPVVPQPNSTMPQITAPSIYAKTVAGYMQTNFINREIGLAQLGRLYERVGEQQLQNAGKSERGLNSWGRTRFTESTLQGKNRFGASSNQGLVQVGQDVTVKEFDSGYARQGLMFSHSWANNQFYDKFRAENGIITTDKAVGKGKTKAFSLGAYHTYYGNDNSYLDVVANLSWLENKYFSTQTARQSGFGAGVSVEVGRSYSLNPQWRIEPQVQLKAQYLTLGSVNDGVRKVKADDNISVQGRVGVHITNNQLYLSTNLVQDLTPAETTVKIGQSSVTERYNATQFDVALGGNVALNRDKTLALYGEAKYSRALGGSNKVFSHRNGRENYTAQIGVRFQW
ncbi:autotransporter outer membrane beta-barrel domain-containing protein [Ursidibacter arcticus]